MFLTKLPLRRIFSFISLFLILTGLPINAINDSRLRSTTIHDYVQPDDHTQPTYGMTPGFKPFTKLMYVNLTFMYIWTLLLECTSGEPRIVLSSASTTRMT